ncbi:hypothetical protein F4779DRAFT_632271 [Xylariaceae sp. FL0662B]|nr:hypothetical protein F4779DRAFT_632271 [Xylariaceae sp. FL0662B]
MAPLAGWLTPRDITFDPSVPSGEFRDQWVTPGDVFSVLLILGGDVVGRALAQIAGSGFTPVSFSFGWVAYSIMALVSAVGENKLMPPDPDCKCKVIHGKSGYNRENSSWILGRIVRDFIYWKDDRVQAKLDEVLDARLAQLQKGDKDAKRPPMAGLIVSVYEASATSPAGTVKRDHVYWIGFPTMVLQLGVAAIPCGLFGDWGVLLVTAVGILLSVLTGLLPQWKKEKWACREKSKHDYILTRGNGSQHAIVILGKGRGFNLEDLASGQANILVATNKLTRFALLILSAFWILLLITAAGLQENSWFLLAVGSVGILQNVYVAGASRRPENFGIPLTFVEVFGKPSVMATLLDVEKKYKHVGRAMLQEFFPGKLRDKEEEEWKKLDSLPAKQDGQAAVPSAASGQHLGS